MNMPTNNLGKRVSFLERICAEDRKRWQAAGQMFNTILKEVRRQGEKIDRQGERIDAAIRVLRRYLESR